MTGRQHKLARLALVAVLATVGPLLVLLAAGERRATALPLYAARAGRTCDNCHADPTGWKNPSLSKRKCNLSCVSCHINPTGGGVRSVSGRYYQSATLPMWFPSHRPYKDVKRQIGFLRFSKTRRNRLPDPAFLSPLGGTSPMAFDQSRYNGLNADPFILLGIDTRYAFYFTGSQASFTGDGSKSVALFFPMQLDVHMALHPFPYFTAFATAGALAKARGYAATFKRNTPFMLKDVALMGHQLPFMGYVKVGRFLPPFGTYIDDHTAPTRRLFGLDHGLLHSRVTGVEVGASPNYPYVNAAVFRPSERDDFSSDDPDNDKNPSFFGKGIGAAVSAGWRDLAWSLGMSAMVRRRDLGDGGNTKALAFNWSLNPWRWIDWLALTYLGEVVFGDYQRPVSGQTATRIAATHQLNWLATNGINLRVRYDYADPDYEIRDDHYHSFSFGGDINLLPSFSIRGEFRWRHNPGEQRKNTTDGILFVRAWY